MSRTRCGGDACGFRVSSQRCSSPRMRPACDSSLTPATTGQTALRDADRSPRVEIPLPGGDRLLPSPPLTCSATMLTLRLLATRESRWSNYTSARLSGVPDIRRWTVGLFYHWMTSVVISTMMWFIRKPSLRNLKVICRHILIWPRRCIWWPITTSYK